MSDDGKRGRIDSERKAYLARLDEHFKEMRAQMESNKGKTVISGNGGDGIHIGPGAKNVHIGGGVDITGNKGHGINYAGELPDAKPPGEDGGQRTSDDWYKKPIGMIGIGVVVAIVAAAALRLLSAYFGA